MTDLLDQTGAVVIFTDPEAAADALASDIAAVVVDAEGLTDLVVPDLVIAVIPGCVVVLVTAASAVMTLGTATATLTPGSSAAEFDPSPATAEFDPSCASVTWSMSTC